MKAPLLIVLFSVALSQAANSQIRYLQARNCNCTIGTLTNSSAVEWFGNCTDGYGTKYYADGSSYYRGRVKANLFIDMAPFVLLTSDIGNFIVDSLLSGGVDRNCEVVKAVFDKDDNPLEVRWRVTCRGQIVNANDNAQVFITLNFIRCASSLYDWIQQQSKDRQQ